MIEILIEHNIATVEEVSLVVKMCGENEKTLNDVLYVRTGYSDIDQFLANEGESS